MEILVAGRLASISSSFFDKLAEHHKVVAASDDVDSDIIGSFCTPFKIGTSDEQYSKLFSAYTFNKVIYFSDRPEDGNGYYNDLEDLENTLALCSDYDVKDFIFIASTFVYDGLDIANEDKMPQPANKSAILINACEQLCDYYRNNRGMSVVVVHIPCLFGHKECKSMIGNMIAQAMVRNHLTIQGQAGQKVDFLAQEDLGELIVRIMYEQSDRLQAVNIRGACQLAFSQLGEIITSEIHSTKISFKGIPAPIGPPVTSKIARDEFDWIPVTSLEDELHSLIKEIEKNTNAQASMSKPGVLDYIRTKSFIIKFIELIAGFFIMEFLNSMTDTFVQFTYVDFRLLYIVIMSITHGLKTGLAATSLASLSCLAGYVKTGTDWRMLLYNIDNWLPFACYLLAGCVTGYIKDKYTNDYTFALNEKDDLKNRYVFLYELYMSVLQNKGQFKKQIMSYRDSFGKIFEITKRLNTTLPDMIYKEALASLEDFLDNQTVGIYTPGKARSTARLEVCSRKIAGTLPVTLDLNKYPVLKETIYKNEVWVNNKLLDEYPDYAFPVFRDERLVMIITIQKASFEQLAMYYQNLFKILCGLIGSSFLRALEYSDKFRNDIYLPSTCVIKKDLFKSLLRVREEMEESSISKYSLISINTNKSTIASVANEVQKLLRENDVLGEGENGLLYIVLTQAGQDEVSIVLERFKTAGLI